MCDVDSFIVGVKHNVLEEEWLIFSSNTSLQLQCLQWNCIYA